MSGDGDVFTACSRQMSAAVSVTSVSSSRLHTSRTLLLLTLVVIAALGQSRWWRGEPPQTTAPFTHTHRTKYHHLLLSDAVAERLLHGSVGLSVCPVQGPVLRRLRVVVVMGNRMRACWRTYPALLTTTLKSLKVIWMTSQKTCPAGRAGSATLCRLVCVDTVPRRLRRWAAVTPVLIGTSRRSWS